MMRKMLVSLLAAMLLLAVSMPAHGELHVNEEPPEDWSERELFRLVVIDVERSDAMLLQCGGENMLVDAGIGTRRDKLYEALDSRGVTHFKYLFSTHSDNDHIQGFRYLIQSGNYEADMFTSPNPVDYEDGPGFHAPVARAVRKAQIPYHVIEEGEQLTLGGASMTVMRCMRGWGRNARSATLMITFGECRVFLTGDINDQAMAEYIEKYGEEALQADVLKAPHHGLTHLPEDFLAAVDPSLLFITNLAQNTSKFRYKMENVYPDIAVLCSGDAEIVLETDGVDWYVWQELEQAE